MQHLDRLVRLCTLLMDSLDVPGDVVELGCNEGKTSVLLSTFIPETKRLWVYDSFKGLPDHSEPVSGEFVPGSMAATAQSVRDRFKRWNQPEPLIVEGFFEDLIGTELPEPICFALLDGDLYRSIRTSLRLVWPRLSPGAICVIDDCLHPGLPGPAKAAVDFFAEQNISVEIHKPWGVGERSLQWWVKK